jgi:hypothetical protein
MTAKWVEGFARLTDEYDSLEVAWHVNNVSVGKPNEETLVYGYKTDASGICPAYSSCPDLDSFRKCPMDTKFIDSTLSCNSCAAVSGQTTCARLDCKQISYYYSTGDKFDLYNWKPELSDDDVVLIKSMDDNKHEVYYSANGLLKNGGKWNLDQ